MSKRLPNTPRSKIRACLRQLWLRSRERAAVLKRDSYCCQACGVKQSTAKGKEVSVEVHHLSLIDWEYLIDLVYERLLQTPEDMTTLCKECHKIEHNPELGVKKPSEEG